MIDDQLRKDPQLGAVIRGLRERAELKRKQVVDALSKRKQHLTGDADAEYSADWYARIEIRPQAHPSAADLEDILQILGSSEQELRSLLDSPKQQTWSDPIYKGDTSRSFAASGSSGMEGNIYASAAITPLTQTSHMALSTVENSDTLLESWQQLNPENQTKALAQVRSLLGRQQFDS